MKSIPITFRAADGRLAARGVRAIGGRAKGAALAAGLSLGGCVNVTAPAEPIVIELNINIKQEVLYRLVDSAQENIENNPEIF